MMVCVNCNKKYAKITKKALMGLANIKIKAKPMSVMNHFIICPKYTLSMMTRPALAPVVR